MQPRERILARLASGFEGADATDPVDPGPTDPRSVALVQLGALLALDAATPSLQRVVCEVELAGVSHDEIVGCAVALLPILGTARMTAVAPRLALVLGYDLEAASDRR